MVLEVQEISNRILKNDMEFHVERDVLLQSLTHIQGVIEKKNTLPILSNVLIQAFHRRRAISDSNRYGHDNK